MELQAIWQLIQAHLDNMQKYESATKKVIKNWLGPQTLSSLLLFDAIRIWAPF